MKNKTILSLLTLLLMTALFFSCATEPTTGGNGNGNGNGNDTITQPSGPDQIEVTIDIRSDMKKTFFSGSTPLMGNLKFYVYNENYKRFDLKANLSISSNDKLITIDKSTYDSIRGKKNLVKVFFPIDKAGYATNYIDTNIDTTISGTKKVTIEISTLSDKDTI